MSKIVLVTGGARSGKSNFAQELVMPFDDVGYIATAVITDDEMRERVKKHRESRPACWHTYEASCSMQDVFDASSHSAYLVDCMTVYLTNYLFDNGGFDAQTQEEINAVEAGYMAHITDVLASLRKKDGLVVLVTNEIGNGIVPETFVSRAFRDIAGRANQKIAAVSDEVYMVCCGIPVKIKG